MMGFGDQRWDFGVRVSFTRAMVLAVALSCLLIGCGDDEGGGEDTQASDTAQTDTSSTSDVLADVQDDAVSELCDADLVRAAIGPIDSVSTAAVTTVEDAATTSFTTTVVVPWDGAADAPYVYLRLLEGTAVPLTDDDALTSEFWDMAIRHSIVRLNGGDSGPAAVEATALNAVDFAAVTVDTPLGDFVSDAVNGTCAAAEDAAALLETAVGTWWTAASTADAPVPAQRVYVIRRLDGDLIKAQIVGLDLAASEATYTIVWGPLDAAPACDVAAAVNEAILPINKVSTGAVTITPGTPTTAVVDASAGGFNAAINNPFVYIDLDAETKVDITDMQSFTDATWDIAFKRAQVRVNGGDSGPGGARVAQLSAASLDAVTTVPADSAFMEDHFVDEDCQVIRDPISNASTAMGQWYEYDVNTHQTLPQPYVYVIETTEGATIKLRVATYSNGTYTLEWAPLP